MSHRVSHRVCLGFRRNETKSRFSFRVVILEVATTAREVHVTIKIRRRVLRACQSVSARRNVSRTPNPSRATVLMMSQCFVPAKLTTTSWVGRISAPTRTAESQGTGSARSLIRRNTIRASRPRSRTWQARGGDADSGSSAKKHSTFEGTASLSGRRSTVLALVTTTTTAFAWLLAPNNATANNDAVLAALKKKESSDSMDSGAVQTRLNLALDELRRVQTLAKVGEYTQARALLRKGALEQTRTDLRKVAQYLRVQRPTFDQFEGTYFVFPKSRLPVLPLTLVTVQTEACDCCPYIVQYKPKKWTDALFYLSQGLAVTGGLDAFDNAMRAVQQGNEEVTARDINLNAKSAVSALEEVCYVLGKDTTYEAMKERMEGGGEKKKEDLLRRDFFAEERAILADARLGAE